MINKKIYTLIFSVLILLIPSCWNFKSNKSKPGLIIINAVDKQCFDDCHIKNSIYVPMDSIEWCKENINAESEIVIHCTNYKCTTSEYVAQKLISYGFKNVYLYKGGTAEWYALSKQDPKRFAIEGPCIRPYLEKPNEKNERFVNPTIKILSAQELADKISKYSLH